MISQIKGIVNKFGIDIVKYKSKDFTKDLDINLRYEFNKEAIESIKIVRKFTMLSYLNLVTLYELVKYCEEANIPGDFIECGVWKGGSVGLMALANLKYGGIIRRNLHLFDIFDDICEPDPEKDGLKAVQDIEYFTGKKSKLTGKIESIKGVYDKLGGHGTLEGNKHLLEDIIAYPKDKINYHVGWFQDTIPLDKDAIDKIAILRLDGDWYESTKICIENLYDKVVEGGVIIIDDYGTYEGCKKAMVEFFENRKLKVFMAYSGTDCRYWIKNKE